MEHPLFKNNLLFMRAVPMYRPASRWNFLQKFLYYVWKAVWIIGALGGIVLNVLDMFWREDVNGISDIALNIMYLELYVSITLRGGYMTFDMKKLDHLAERLTSEFKMRTTLALKPKTTEALQKFCDTFFKLWMAFVVTAAWFMVIGALIRTTRTLPIQIWVWYDWTTTRNYYITIFVEFVTLSLTLTTFGNVDMLNATFMFLTIGEIDMLACDFEDIFNNALAKQGFTKEEIFDYIAYEDNEAKIFSKKKLQDKVDNVINGENFKVDLLRNFGYCVKRHQQLLDYIKEYQDFISPYLLVEISFIFCYIIFMLFIFVITDNKSLYVVIIQYVTGASMQIYLVTYLGDRMTTSLAVMREKLYAIPWYTCEKRFLTNFKIVQMRMSKPVSVNAGKVLSMSLDTFLEFMKKAFSFFTVLRQVNNP